MAYLNTEENMFRKLLAVFVISGFLVSGCATKGGYTPTIDSYNDPNADRIAQDLVECRQLAEQAAGCLLYTSDAADEN